MSRKQKRKSPEWQWEQALIDAFSDKCWHDVLDPLYEKFQRWKVGELGHWDMDEAIHEVHRQNQRLYGFFDQRREMIVFLIQYQDQEWFTGWVAEHPPPPGVEVYKPPTYVEVEEAEGEGNKLD